MDKTNDGIIEATFDARGILDASRKDRLDLFGREVRSIPNAADSEIRATDAGPVLAGHAAVFNTETVIGSWFREMILPGAFKKTIREADVRHLFNHDPNMVLARTKNKTLALKEDKIGLAFEAQLNPDDPDAIRVAAKVERGDVSQSSFAFQVISEEWEPGIVDEATGTRKLPLRKIKEARLFDTSSVTYPAYEQAETVLKSSALDRLLVELGEETGARLLRHLTVGEDLDPDVISEIRAADGTAPESGEAEAQAAPKAPADNVSSAEDSARDTEEEFVKYTDERAGWSFEGSSETLLEVLRLRNGEQTIVGADTEDDENIEDERSDAQALADERKARFAERQNKENAHA